MLYDYLEKTKSFDKKSPREIAELYEKAIRETPHVLNQRYTKVITSIDKPVSNIDKFAGKIQDALGKIELNAKEVQSLLIAIHQGALDIKNFQADIKGLQQIMDLDDREKDLVRIEIGLPAMSAIH